MNCFKYAYIMAKSFITDSCVVDFNGGTYIVYGSYIRKVRG